MAAAAFAEVADRAPGEMTPFVGGNDAWGNLLRSWSVPYSGAYRTGPAWMSDNYILFGQWSSTSTWVRFTEMGSAAGS